MPNTAGYEILINQQMIEYFKSFKFTQNSDD